jgi:hypothetical protein
MSVIGSGAMITGRIVNVAITGSALLARTFDALRNISANIIGTLSVSRLLALSKSISLSLIGTVNGSRIIHFPVRDVTVSITNTINNVRLTDLVRTRIVAIITSLSLSRIMVHPRVISQAILNTLGIFSSKGMTKYLSDTITVGSSIYNSALRSAVASITVIPSASRLMSLGKLITQTVALTVDHIAKFNNMIFSPQFISPEMMNIFYFLAAIVIFGCVAVIGLHTIRKRRGGV